MKQKSRYDSLRSALLVGAFFFAIIFLVGGCIRIDYAVFKAKYPNTTTFDYVWSNGSRK